MLHTGETLTTLLKNILIWCEKKEIVFVKDYLEKTQELVDEQIENEIDRILLENNTYEY
jgi:hypothetical protein